MTDSIDQIDELMEVDSDSCPEVEHNSDDFCLESDEEDKSKTKTLTDENRGDLADVQKASDSTLKPSDQLNSNLNVQEIELTLRNYQKELVELANKGKNVIVCAPPGAGKTIVAWNIIKNFLVSTSRQTSKKVLVFTPAGALATQQHERLKKFLPKKYKVDIICGSSENSAFVVLKHSDVVVLTPQILINELKSTQEPKSVESISDFGLLIFDECHHCTKKHPYNEVMKLYFELKYQPNQSAVQLPQIIGLSATLGIGKSLEIKSATSTMKQLCANLDAIDGIVSVKKHIKELEEHITQPCETRITMEERDKDKFSEEILKFMRFVKNVLEELVGDPKSPPFPRDEVSKQVFKQWCSEYRDNQVSQPSVVGDEAKAKIAHSCLDYFELCTDALDYYFKFRSQDVVGYLESALNRQKKTVSRQFHAEETKIMDKAEDTLRILRSMVHRPECTNLNLIEAENLILTKFSNDDQSKGMIMVQMRRYATAVKNWIADNKKLQFLKAEVFTGTGRTPGEEDNTLTHQQQKRVMEDFREGKHKLLICTPDAAGEGMDVAGCNFVIIYDIMTNEITDTQIKGRARRKESEVYQFSSPRVAHRDHLNKEKTILMKKVRNQIEDEIEKDIAQYQKEICLLQRSAYQLSDAAKKVKTPDRSDDEFLIKCKRCPVEVCSSYDLRVIEGMHHVCLNPDFAEKYRTEILEKKKNIGSDYEPTNSVLCDSCGAPWGMECKWKGQATIALLQVKSFSFLMKKNRKGKAWTPKKWKQVPFRINEAKQEEILDYALNS